MSIFLGKIQNCDSILSKNTTCLHSDMVSYFYVDKTTDFKLLMFYIFQVFIMDVMKLKD